MFTKPLEGEKGKTLRVLFLRYPLHPSIHPSPFPLSPCVHTSSWCLLGLDAARLGTLLFLMSHGIIKLNYSGKPEKFGSMCVFGALQECSCLDV